MDMEDGDHGVSYMARLLRDGVGWQASSASTGDDQKSGLFIVDQYPMESIEKYPFKGPAGLMDEDDVTQFGWALVHCPEFARQVKYITSADQLSVNNRLVANDMKNYMPAAREHAKRLQQRMELDRTTHVPMKCGHYKNKRL